ncbi:multidrug efflux SMR transporter [Desulfobacter hydrogenophilus]
MGTADTAWTGIEAVGVAIMGMILFNESRDVLRIICLLLIVAGKLVLN